MICACALALLAFAVCEWDNYLDQSIAHGADVYFLVSIAVFSMVVAYCGRRTLHRQIESYVMTPLIDDAVVRDLCYAQVIGQESFWLAVSTSTDTLLMRRAVEEVSETLVWEGRIDDSA